MTDFYEDRVRVFLGELVKLNKTHEQRVYGFKYKYCGYKNGNELPVIDESFKTLEKGEYWGGKAHIHAWFYKKLEIPEDMLGKDIVLRLDTVDKGWNASNPQFIAYVDGAVCQGLDINHRELYLDKAKKVYDIYIYAYASDYSTPFDFKASLIEYDREVNKLFNTLSVAYEASLMYNPNDKIYSDIEKAVIGAVNLVDLRKGRSEEFLKSIKLAQKYIDSNLIGKSKETTSVICVGHTHIDVAWLWTLDQTREKVVRSFSNVIALMKRYPEYKFISSQAQLYKFLKEESPELYEEVKRLVREGRWEVEGAMWVEADCNLCSGESLVRQILYGKQFFRREFGVDCHVLWLPDVFGYSAALPQILKKSGIDKFVTSKISWNETNRMPYDIFFWHGIDGTDIFTYFLTAQRKERGKEPITGCTYNAWLDPAHLAGAYDRLQQKYITDEVMISYGYGDGGGGPTQKYLDYYDILKKGVPGVPTAKIEFAGSFLERVKKKAEKNPKTPHWYGELYLEYHRGTYTSMAKNKRYNRKSEFLLEKAETLSLAAEFLAGKTYPSERIYDSWETVLLNQFHDIIPGSSIKEVYDESWKQYEKVSETGKEIVASSEKAITDRINTDGGIIVFNNNSFVSSGPVKLDGKTIFVKDIPAKGYKVVKEFSDKNSIKVTSDSIENKYLKLVFDKKGAFTKIYDKKNKRSVLKPGCRGNVLMAYEDLPRDYDNWEISNYYTEKSWEIDEVVSTEPVNDGVRAGIRIEKKFLDSILVQTIWLYEDMPGIYIENDFDWKEKHIIVKAEFPVDINSQRASYDTQFGFLERPTHMNTSWDAAKFEVCAHKYADYSEHDYGVAILNDCKYGHDIHNGIMKLTLLKCGTHPNPEADKCRHEFTYAVYPHSGDFREAGVIKAAYELNVPMTAEHIGKQSGNLNESYSLFALKDRTPYGGNIFCETIKKAEDGSGAVVRLYEGFNKRTSADITFGFDFDRAYICGIMEDDVVKEVKADGRSVKLDFAPFEIVTLKLVF